MYVPRDEALDDSKTKAVAAGKLKGLLKNLIPTLRNASMNSYSIKDFSEINSLYKRRTPLGVQLPIENWSRLPLPSMLTKIPQSIKEIYKFDPPNGISRGASCCLRDDEFGRLTLRGLNPLSIERLKALEEKKLFILDYHDIYLPFLNRINALGCEFICMEPFIIAAHRQLSVMHPVYKLLKPHMRDTLAINAQAREVLVNAKGIIECYFTPEKYCMEITQSAYRDWGDSTWRAFLLTLLEEASLVQYDTELQACYNEFINVGHADVSHADWWPKLSTPEDLTSSLLPSYGLPTRHFLSSLPSLPETTYFMSVLDILSTHATDEQYIGGRKDLSAWGGDTEIIEAFYKFSMEIKKIEKEIERRNADPKLSNRCGPGIAPYELLLPSSGPGVTGRGVPNSISM
ncbi:hypothetical protein GH714_033122 [Hevea brasiliensis]|uniref:Lipoxygenase domain-containing protein n=1 Tax=Hevea brasiliensis TaxID=3981 RepID=A0A6A6LW91_HEVBR|nr:hypothetical protein GH714_033122 [Hevea brasiliensis]